MSTGLLEKSLTTPTQTNDRPSDGDVSASQLDCKSIALHCILVPKEFCVNDYSEHRVEPTIFFPGFIPFWVFFQQRFQLDHNIERQKALTSIILYPELMHR